VTVTTLADTDIIHFNDTAQTATFVVQLFEAGLGHTPTQATLSSMLSSGLTQPQLAEAFVASQAFANTNNGGVLVNPNAHASPTVVDSLFMNTLGHLPTQSTLAGYESLTNEQALVAFATSDTVANVVGSVVTSYVDSYGDGLIVSPGIPIDTVHFI
jgi:hypothetical protein